MGKNKVKINNTTASKLADFPEIVIGMNGDKITQKRWDSIFGKPNKDKEGKR